MERLQPFLSQQRKDARNRGLDKKSRTKRFGNSPRLRPGTKIIQQNNLFTLKKNKGIKNSRVKPPIQVMLTVFYPKKKKRKKKKKKVEEELSKIAMKYINLCMHDI
jgi:hypothetical protein